MIAFALTVGPTCASSCGLSSAVAPPSGGFVGGHAGHEVDTGAALDGIDDQLGEGRDGGAVPGEVEALDHRRRYN